MLRQSHPNVYVLINFIKKMNNSTLIDIERVNQGQKISRTSTVRFRTKLYGTGLGENWDGTGTGSGRD